MKIYSNGKERTLTGSFPARFKLLNNGVEVPFIRTGKGSVRLSGKIPFGELDVEEVIKQKTPQPARLDAQSIAIINKSDFDQIDILSKKLAINQEQMNAHLSALTEHEATLATLETQNSQAIEQTNESMTEMAKVFGKEIQADRERIKETALSIEQDIAVSSEALSAKIEEHEKAKNPHKITKETIGLDNVENTSDLDKPVSKATKQALDKKADKSDIEDVRKAIKATEKKQERLVKSIDNANLYGGVGGNELPTGGKKGQVLGKKSDKSGDYVWFDNAGSPSWGNIGGNINNQTDLKNALDSKQNVIDDLEAIRQGAEAGSTAVQPNDMTKAISDHNTSQQAHTYIQGLITSETTNRENADIGLQNQIDAITSSSDVKDIVGTYSQLQAYDTSTLGNNDIIKVLQDETHSDKTTYYRWSTTTETFTLIGEEGPYYTKSESNSTFVPQTRTINNKALSSNITLTASDVGALPDSTVIPTVNNATLKIQKNGTDVATFTANSSTNETANIIVPTKTSDITNDSGFITSSALNGYATETWVGQQGFLTSTALTGYATQQWVGQQGYITDITSAMVTTALGYSPVNPTSLASVATSGSYNDLSNKPTIPTVNNPTITLTQGGVAKGSFTLNQSTADTIELDDGGSPLPSQTGNAGKFLTTDGTNSSWNYTPTNKIGEIIQVACTSSYVPDGCLPCDGSEYTKAQFPDLWNNYLTTTEVISKTWYAWTFDDQLDQNYIIYTESATPSVGDNVYRFNSDGTPWQQAYTITAVGSGTITVHYRKGVECPRQTSADTTKTTPAPTKLITCSYTEYQSDISTYGQCGKFAVDTTNQKFKVPTIKDGSYLTQAKSDTELGKAYNESLPNIRGTLGILDSSIPVDGAFEHGTTNNNSYGFNQAHSDWAGQLLNANKSSSTYQDGAKVQGDNIRVRFFVVVSNGQINQSQMDWSQWASSLSGKMNADLSNMNATDTAKENIIAWSMPDFTAKIETQNTTYTAPTKGWFYVMTQGAELKVSINGAQLAHGTRSAMYYNVCYSLAYMVNAGDVITVTGADVARETPLIAFYPCKGVSIWWGDGEPV